MFWLDWITSILLNVKRQCSQMVTGPIGPVKGWPGFKPPMLLFTGFIGSFSRFNCLAVLCIKPTGLPPACWGFKTLHLFITFVCMCPEKPHQGEQPINIHTVHTLSHIYIWTRFVFGQLPMEKIIETPDRFIIMHLCISPFPRLLGVFFFDYWFSRGHLPFPCGGG